jgi:hypothetical protein
MKYRSILLITDADGTLLTDNKRILKKDKLAIAKFIENGGTFTIATGRGVALARVVVEELGLDLISLPAVVFNGAAIYDFASNEFLWRCSLCEKGRGFVEKVIERFPDIGVEILVNDDIYVTSTNKYEEDHLELGVMEPIRCKYHDVPQSDWLKVLFVDDPEIIDELVQFVEDNPCDDVHVVRSAPMYFEVLPRGVDKGSGFKRLLEIMQLKDMYIVAAGDFMNDIEMIREAHLGVAVGNAEQVVKDCADVIVCDNNHGIIGEILECINVDTKGD